MSDSGANEDELIKQKLSGVMEVAGVTPTDETLQTMYEFVLLKKSMNSTKGSSPPSATQEVKLLPKTHVESQPKVDSPQEGRITRNKTEQVERVTKIARPEECTATLDSPSTVKIEPTPLKSVGEPQTHTTSQEDGTGDEEISDEDNESDLQVYEELCPIEHYYYYFFC
jgi:hypothetical protein